MSADATQSGMAVEAPTLGTSSTADAAHVPHVVNGQAATASNGNTNGKRAGSAGLEEGEVSAPERLSHVARWLTGLTRCYVASRSDQKGQVDEHRRASGSIGKEAQQGNRFVGRG